MRPRALIAEDEPLLAEHLRTLLARSWPELEIAALVNNGLEALERILAEHVDVAFLDIRMPGLTGLEVAAELADRLPAAAPAPALVFVTAYDQHALQAFDLAAADYLLKPVTEERLGRCVERLKARLARPAVTEALVGQLRQLLGAQPAAPAEPLRALRAGSGSTVKMIPLDSVCYFQASDKYTAVVTAEGEALIRTPLKELLAQLPAERFKQVHRGTIVNLDEVAAAERDDAGRVTLRLKRRSETLPVSRLYAELFRQM